MSASVVNKLTVPVEQYGRLNPDIEGGLKDRLESLMGYRFDTFETVSGRGVPQMVVTLQRKQTPGSLADPAMQEDEAFRFLETVLKADISLSESERRRLVDARRDQIIASLVERWAKQDVTLEISKKERDKHTFKLDKCSHPDIERGQQVREHVRGELEDQKILLRRYDEALARTLPLNIDAVVATFEKGPFRKFLGELRAKWALPVELKKVVAKPPAILRAAVQFLPAEGSDLLAQYVGSALRNAPPESTANLAAHMLATREYEVWQDYLQVFRRHGFEVRLVNLPRDAKALQNPEDIPALLAARQAELSEVDQEIAGQEEIKRTLSGRERKPVQHGIDALRRRRNERIIGLESAGSQPFTHDEVLKLASVVLPAGQLVFPALLLTHADPDRFVVEDLNGRMAVMQGVLNDLVQKKAAMAARNLAALRAYADNLARHQWSVRTLAEVQGDPSVLSRLDGAQLKHIMALREKVGRFEDGKRGKTGQALLDYRAANTDPASEPVMPRWETVPATGLTSLESKIRKGLGRLRRKDWSAAGREETEQSVGVEEAMTLDDLEQRIAAVEAREARQFNYNSLVFRGSLVVRAILGEKASNLSEATRLAKVNGVRHDLSPDGNSVSILIPVSASEGPAGQLQDLLVELEKRARALGPAYMATGGTAPIFSHNDVVEVFRDRQKRTASLPPGELIRKALTAAGHEAVTIAVAGPALSAVPLTFNSEALADIINKPSDAQSKAFIDWRRELGRSNGTVVALRAAPMGEGFVLEITPMPDADRVEKARSVLTYLESVLRERDFVSPQDIEQARKAADAAFKGLHPYERMHGGRQVLETLVGDIQTPNIERIAFLTNPEDEGYMEARITMQKGVPSYCKDASFLHYLAAHDAWAVFEKDERLKGLKVRTESNVITFTGATPERVRMAVEFFRNYLNLVDQHRGNSQFALSTLLQVAIGRHALPDPNSVAAQRGITTPAILRNVVPNTIEPKSDNQHAYQYALEKYPVVIAIGRAGTGKGFLAGNESVRAQCGGQVEQIIWSNFMAKQGASLGALPGDFLQKLQFLYAPFIENYIKAIIGPELQKNKALKKVNELMADSGLEMPGFNSIDILDPRFAMGRTFDNTNIYIDEAQLMPKNYIEVLMQRVGQGTKLRIMGSLEQIIDADIFRRPYTDPEGCGLAFALHCAVHVPAVREMTGIVFLDSPDDVKRSDVSAVWGDAFAEINRKLNSEPSWKRGLVEDAEPHALRFDRATGLVMPASELAKRVVVPIGNGRDHGTALGGLPMMRETRPNGTHGPGNRADDGPGRMN